MAVLGSSPLTIPANTAPGTYYIIAQADGDDDVVETSDVNNKRSATFRVRSN